MNLPKKAKASKSASNEKETVNSLYRQWQILSKLPTGKWIGTRQLQEQLQREGIDISIRTIQRDLNQIATRFPIESNKETPQGWRWQEDAPIQSLPHMNSSQAVTFMMVEDHLKHLLPPSLLDEMRPWFDLARRSLSSEHNNVRQWINRVRIVPATQPLIPPPVDARAQQSIYEALLQDRQLRVSYKARTHQGEDKIYTLNPLALVQRGAIIYLICTRHDKPDIRQFALHRFSQATVLDTRSMHPVDFNIDDYLASGALGFVSHNHQTVEPAFIELLFHPKAGQSFFESRLSEDQTIEKLDSGEVRVTATVPLTAQLVWWLRAYGKLLIDVKPKSLAEEVYETAYLPSTEATSNA
ncbi:helix-turn-helix transcriptional regulator [Alkanindiges sp. WGS2144]|uniref:helix-turn-helix transcriptional regulator n=1 Tax=Alkanindiges sp. WGS2144 TaxID=3366808 RepID=UPI0037508E5E